MHGRAWLVPLVLLALPLASAAYGTGSQIEASPHVVLEGRADTWLPGGIASYVGASASQIPLARLMSGEAQVKYVTLTRECGALGLPNEPCVPVEEAETLELREIRSVTVTKALSSYKLLATTDRHYADSPAFGREGRILVTTITGAALDATRESLHISASEGDWRGDAGAEPMGIVYAVDASSAQLTATAAAALRATGGFELYLQGVEVPLRGVDKAGKEVSRTFDTRVPSDPNAPLRYVVIEVSDGDLQMSSTGAFRGFAPADQRPITDVHSGARFRAATGTIDYADKEDRTLSNEDVSLVGPLSLTLTKVTSGSSPRATYAIADGLRLQSLEPLPDDEGIPAAALAAASAVGAGGAGALIGLAYFWPRLKFWATLLALPMYTRIERTAVLQHEKRDELYELIRTTPGIHAHEIGEKANIGWGTTVYHLKLLENHGLIVSKKSGRYKRFFVNTGEYTKKKDIYGALRNETAKSVAQYIVDHPGTTQKEMCAALGIQPSLASWHVEKLEGVELVKRVKDGRMVRYFAGPAWQDLNVRVNPMAAPGADTPVET
ncbi:MAG TPA: hypothetical protein VFH78_09670 [Candidatus Thermoplasmatota archaeon]|nr:hypothetical protein [Candidatus Thermoplasmatota archaeon]